MKRIIMMTIGVILGITVMSAARQDRGEIRGKVIDADTGEPVGWATVAIFGQDSTLICGTACDENGVYSLQAMPGKYTFAASFIGYKDTRMEINLMSGMNEAAPIRMESETQTISGAIVTGRVKLVEMKVDKLVMNVSQSAFAQGSNAMDLIRKAPGVTIDKDGNIKLNGKSVAVWIDGRPSYMSGQALESLLKSTGGETIEKFEIMEHPSAKYDAEGQGGIINIKTKRNALSGFNGSIGTDGGGMHFGNIDKTYWQTSNYANLSYRGKKTSTYINIYGNIAQTGLEMDVKNEISTAAGMYAQESNSLLKSDWRNWQVKFGNDWSANEKNTFGVIITVPGTRSMMPSGRNDNQTVQSLDGRVFDISESDIRTSGKMTQVNANLNWTHTFDAAKASEMTVNADWYRNMGNTKNLQGTYSHAPGTDDWTETRRDIISDNDIDIYSAKLDWQSVVFGKAMLEAGGKWALSSTDNDMTREDTGMPDRRTVFNYREHIGAGYVSMSMQMGAKWSAKAGLRGEYTNSYGDWKSEDTHTRRSYLDVFPTVYIGFVPAEKWRMSMSYTRRITRPDYNRLNPVEIYVDSHNCIVGDPDIKPEYNDNVAMQFGFGQYLSWSLGYNFTNGLMDQKPIFKENGDEILKWGNFGRRHMAFASFNISELPLSKWLSWTLSVSGMYLRNLGSENYVNSTPSANAYTCFTFALPKDWKIQLDASGMTAMSWGYFKMHPMFTSNAAVRKTLLSGKLTLTANFTDIFRSMKTNLDVVGMEGVEHSYIGQKYYYQKVRIGAAWSFGKAQQTKYRKVGNLEEASRVSSGSNGLAGGQK